MSRSSVKRLGKRIIDYPEETAAVASVTEWLRPLFSNPTKPVCIPTHFIPFLIRHRSKPTSWACFQSLVGLLAIVCRSPRSSWLRFHAHILCTDLGWLTGDLIAGLTVGIVVVPQSMSYAQVLDTYLTASYPAHRRLVRSQTCLLNMGYTPRSSVFWFTVYVFSSFILPSPHCSE